MTATIDELTVQINMFAEPKRKQNRVTKKRRNVGSVLMLGGGRQSSALAEMTVTGDLAPFDLVLFADTRDEPEYVYEQVAYLKGRLATIGTPLETVYHQSGEGLMQHAKAAHPRYAKMPFFVLNPDGSTSQLPRQCTKEFKVDPCDAYLRKWLIARGLGKVNKAGAHRVDLGVYVDVSFGFGIDEAYRVNRKPFAVGWKQKAFPLYNAGISTKMLMQWFVDKGLPVPKKSSCIQCPYHDDAHWLDMSINRVAEFEVACSFDEYARTDEAKARLFRGIVGECYLHPSGSPLRSVDFVHWKTKRRANPYQIELLIADQPSCSMDGFSCAS